MKKMLLLSLLIAPLGSVFAMDSLTSVPNAKSSSSPLYIAELRLLITAFIGEQLSIEEAIKTIKAWALTDTRSYGFFQTPEHAQSFLKWFNALSYHHDFTLWWLHTCNTLLPKEEVSTFNHSVEKGSELVKLLETCASQKEWSPFFKEASELEKSGLSKYLAHYYWKSTYMNSEAKKRLLLWALELQAPQEVITTLIRWGSCLTQLHKKTPPPCLIVCQNIVAITKEYDEKLKKPRADVESLKKDYEPVLEQLQTCLEGLITYHASVNDFFFTPDIVDINNTKITPLHSAIKANNTELVTYLSNQKAQCSLPLIVSTVSGFAQGLVSYATLETLLSKGNSASLTFLFHMMIEFAIQSTDEKIEEKYCQLVPLFLNLNVDINAVSNKGLTALDMVNQYAKKDSKIGSLLIAHGALSPHENDVNFHITTGLISKMQNFFKLLPVGNPETCKSESIRFLNDIKTILCTHDSLKVSSDLIHSWIYIALSLDFSEDSSSQEGKEFLKFVAFRFPRFPLCEELVCHNRTFKQQLPNEEAYKPILKQTANILSWLSQEGIQDSSLPQAIEVAKEFGMDELAVCLSQMWPHS